MKLTDANKVILSRFVDPEQRELSQEEAEKAIRKWIDETNLFHIGVCMLFKLNSLFYFNKKNEKEDVTERVRT